MNKLTKGASPNNLVLTKMLHTIINTKRKLNTGIKKNIPEISIAIRTYLPPLGGPPPPKIMNPKIPKINKIANKAGPAPAKSYPIPPNQ
jgi:hypothetical protein